MSKGRKTTSEEKIEIVQYCIDNNYDYKGAVFAYKVSYSQDYSWTKKFNNEGKEGLADNRWKGKVEE